MQNIKISIYENALQEEQKYKKHYPGTVTLLYVSKLCINLLITDFWTNSWSHLFHTKFHVREHIHDTFITILQKNPYVSNSSWKHTLGEKRTNEQEQILTADG